MESWPGAVQFFEVLVIVGNKSATGSWDLSGSIRCTWGELVRSYEFALRDARTILGRLTN